MDQRLVEASMLGDVEALNALLKKNPVILDQVFASHSADNTPLHIAALGGHLGFFMEVLKKRPSFAQELNKDGFAPIHLATAAGHVKVVNILIEASIDQCTLKDKGGRTALHYAAIRGRVEIIEVLCARCPQVIEQETVLGESALLLAVKNSQFEAFKVLFETSEKHDDDDGEKHEERMKGILDLANATDQRQVAKFLVQKSIEYNDESVTVVDVDEHPSDDDAPEPAKSTFGREFKKSISELKNVWGEIKKSISELKNAWGKFYDEDKVIPIVAGLIAQTTYQAAINPPPSIWKEGMDLDTKCMKSLWSRDRHKTKLKNMLGHDSSCPANAYYVFMALVVIAFTTSMLLIPFHQSRGLTIALMIPCLFSMLLSVGFAIVTTSSSNGFDDFVVYLLVFSTTLLFAGPQLFVITKVIIRITKVKRNVFKDARTERGANVERSSSSTSQTSSRRMVH